MVHKLLMIAVLALILFIVWSSMKGYILIWSLLALAIVAALYYVCTSVLTKGMCRKAYGDGIFSCRAGMIVNGGKDLSNGRLIATSTELMFVRRKGDLGGCKVCWSAPTAAVEGYTLGKVDEYHMGINFTIKGEKKDIFFPSKEIAGLEKEFRKAIGWSEEEESPTEN